MNAITSPLVPALAQLPFDRATETVQAWRGHCLDAFARAEAAVTACLAVLSGMPNSGPAVRLPHLVGQRLEALAEALSDAEPLGPDIDRAKATLALLREHDRLRTMLCHGVASVLLDRHGRWTMVLRLTAFRAKRIVQDTLILTEQEAGERRDDLVRTSQTLCAQLGQVRAICSGSGGQGRQGETGPA